MTHDRYDIKWVGRCQFIEEDGSEHDKVWGWFIYKDPSAPVEEPQPRNRFGRGGIKHSYTFWARTGKTPSFKKHAFSVYSMDGLVNSKKKRKYDTIELGDLLAIWPTVYEDLDNKFVFHLLAENI